MIIIDTPGFGDPSGIKHDRINSNLIIRSFFDN